jgi:hypothetical protein
VADADAREESLSATADVSYVKDGKRTEGAMPIPYPNDAGFWNADWQFQKVAINPDMLLQFCHKFAEMLRSRGAEQVEIRGQVLVSLNGREPRPLIDSKVNLADEPRRWLTSYPWVLPFDPTPVAVAPSEGKK